MADVRTNILLEAKAKGLDKFASLAKMLDSGTKGFLGLKKSSGGAEASVSKFKKEIGDLEDQLKDLAKSQLSVMREMGRTDRASNKYKELTDKLRGLETQQARVQKQAVLTTRAYSDQAKAVDKAQKAAGSFTQGFLQGSLPGASMIQRGPGAMRQAAGVAIGGRMRQFGGGMGAAPFTGTQGLMQALSAIPGGGLIAGPMQSAMSMAGQSLSYQQAQMGAAPIMGMPDMRAIGGRAAAGVRRPKGLLSASDKSWQALEEVSNTSGMRLVGEELKNTFKDPAMWNPMTAVLKGGLRAVRGDFSPEKMREMAVDRKEYELGGEERAYLKKRAQAAAKAEGAARREFEAPLRSGLKMGFGRQEMLQMGGQLGQVAGGEVLQEQAGRKMLPFAAAAQRALGLGGGVSGAYLMAQRRGGIAGGPGGAEGMTKAIGDAMALGLKGSELIDYMQQTAEGITAWKTTGIPIDTQSVGAMGVAAAQMGLGGLQGARVARGMQGAGRQMAAGGGPQSAAQMAMFQDIFGFEGGGLKEFQQAMMKAEEGTMAEGGFQKFLQRALQAGGGTTEGGVMTAKQMFSRAGMQGPGMRDLELMMKQLQGEKLSAVEQERLTKVQGDLAQEAGAALTPGDIRKRAEAVTPAAVAKQKAIEDKQLGVGRGMLPAVQDMQNQATAMAKTVSLFSPEIKKLTGNVSEAASSFESFVGRMRKIGLAEALEVGN